MNITLRTEQIKDRVNAMTLRDLLGGVPEQTIYPGFVIFHSVTITPVIKEALRRIDRGEPLDPERYRVHLLASRLLAADGYNRSSYEAYEYALYTDLEEDCSDEDLYTDYLDWVLK